MTWHDIMFTSRMAIKKKLSWIERQKQQPSLNEALETANEQYSFSELKEDKFMDEGK